MQDGSAPTQPPQGDGVKFCASDEFQNSEMCPLQPETQPLPPGWEVRLAIGTMKPFFYNPGSNEFSWSFPGLRGGPLCCPRAEPTAATVQDVEMQVDGANGQDPQRAQDGVVQSAMPQSHLNNKDLERNHPDVEEQAKLNATGLLTGLAIAIHNFPEGLATFVATMADPSLGAAIAVAIAIHNIPEVGARRPCCLGRVRLLGSRGSKASVCLDPRSPRSYSTRHSLTLRSVWTGCVRGDADLLLDGVEAQGVYVGDAERCERAGGCTLRLPGAPRRRQQHGLRQHVRHRCRHDGLHFAC